MMSENTVKTKFDSPQFLTLNSKQKREFVIEEFKKCRNSFQYFLDNYAFIRHKVGIIKMKPFDFQLDVVLPIAEVLIKGRSKKVLEDIKKYQLKFDYKQWLQKIEQNIELAKLIPQELHDFYLNIVPSPYWNENIDTIILKSRQTGLSTIFQVLNAWHINFHDNIQDLVISFREKESKKYMNDVQRIWQNIPALIRAKKLKKNEHELAVSLTGEKDRFSVIGSFTASPDAARSYSPNLVILDEFASYKNVEALWSAVVGSLSTGGIMVIISTPKGVGNLYYELWQKTKEIMKNPSVKVDGLQTNFKPFVIHWSQLPDEEFHRRGFEQPDDWYRWMKGYLIMEGGEKKAAQELDLEFITSGNTALSTSTISNLHRKPRLDVVKPPKVLTYPEQLKGLKIYEMPQNDYEYMLGIDVAEGKGKDYSTIQILKIPKDKFGLPEIVAEYRSNIITEKKFADLILHTAKLYNDAWINIEYNNAGKVVISYLIDIMDNPDKILNTYKVSTRQFIKRQKGFDERSGRSFLVSYGIEFVEHWHTEENFYITETLFSEFLTFLDKGNRYEHADGKHDDQIFAYFLALTGIFLLDKYKMFLIENGDSLYSLDIDDYLFSSNIQEKIQYITETNQKYIEKTKLEKDDLLNIIDKKNDDNKKENDNDNNYGSLNKSISKVYDIDDSDDIFIF